MLYVNDEWIQKDEYDQQVSSWCQILDLSDVNSDQKESLDSRLAQQSSECGYDKVNWGTSINP